MKIIAMLGSPLVMVLVAAVVCGGLSWRLRRSEPVVLGGVGLGVTGLLDVTTKNAVARLRPPTELHAVTASGFSFPSGHAIFSAVTLLLCTSLLTRRLVRGTARRVALWVVSSAMIAAIGYSRVFLGVHYPSDVLAGWCLAVAWTTALVLAFDLWTRRRQAQYER